MSTAATFDRSPGAQAVVAWSRRIHRDGDRHNWAVACAELLDQHGPDAELPPFPSGFRSTRESRDETVRRLWRQASATADVGQPDLFGGVGV